jgi:hypothetical protein
MSAVTIVIIPAPVIPPVLEKFLSSLSPENAAAMLIYLGSSNAVAGMTAIVTPLAPKFGTGKFGAGDFD